MATFLQQQVLGKQNVTHLRSRTDDPFADRQHYPDMVGLETIQQFALLNQVTLSESNWGGTPLTAKATRSMHRMRQSPARGSCNAAGILPNCQGLDFRDQAATTKLW